MAEPIPLFPRKKRWPSAAAAAAGATSVLALLLATGGQPEPQHPEWAEVTRELESNAWPLVRAARYDPANHFVLVDLHLGVAPHVVVRLACEDVRQPVPTVLVATFYGLSATAPLSTPVTPPADCVVTP
jgi:hypothetical protein